MGARKSRMKRKAYALIKFGYKPTFRQLMESYRFWKKYMKKHGNVRDSSADNNARNGVA